MRPALIMALALVGAVAGCQKQRVEDSPQYATGYAAGYACGEVAGKAEVYREALGMVTEASYFDSIAAKYESVLVVRSSDYEARVRIARAVIHLGTLRHEDGR